MKIKITLLYASILLLFNSYDANAKSSTCFGTTSSGSIKSSVALPLKDKNFNVFSQLAWYLGRTFVHSEVSDIFLKTYQELKIRLPDHQFVYGETGWSQGGTFKPHKTHQNGLSVDFMVPTLNSSDQSITFPMNLSNKWGYEVDFDSSGEFNGFTIDFEAMALHLRLLFEQSQKAGFEIERVFFDPRLQPKLFSGENGQFIQSNIKFNYKQAWVRHDEHYHVDFKVPCQ